jgi:ketosteroid isomerase-like protein
VSGPDEIAAQIRAAEDRRYAAMVGADVGALGELLSDRLVYSHSNGSRDSRESLLAKIGDGSLLYIALEHPVTQVIVLGDAALVIGEMHGDVVVDGLSRQLHSAILAVWAAHGDGWQLAAFQPTKLPD